MLELLCSQTNILSHRNTLFESSFLKFILSLHLGTVNMCRCKKIWIAKKPNWLKINRIHLIQLWLKHGWENNIYQIICPFISNDKIGVWMIFPVNFLKKTFWLLICCLLQQLVQKVSCFLHKFWSNMFLCFIFTFLTF